MPDTTPRPDADTADLQRQLDCAKERLRAISSTLKAISEISDAEPVSSARQQAQAALDADLRMKRAHALEDLAAIDGELLP